MNTFRLALIGILALVAFLIPSPVQVAADPTQPGLHILSETDREIVLSYTLPGYQLINQQTELGPCQEVTVSEAWLPTNPGETALPTQSVLVGVPAQREIRLEVLRAEYQNIPGVYQLCTTQWLPPELDESGVFLTSEPQIVKTVYKPEHNAVIPDAPAKVLQRGYIRNQAVVQLGISPAQYLAGQGTIRFLTALEVRLSWEPVFSPSGDVPSADDMDPLLGAHLINDERASAWRGPGASAALSLQSAEAPTTYNLTIPAQGLYVLTGGDLQAAGVPIDQIGAQNLHISYKGTELPLLVERQSPSVFQAGDKLIFYGFPEGSLYVNANTFQLSWDSNASRQIATLTSPATGSTFPLDFFTDRQRFNQDRIYVGAYGSGIEKDHWYWSIVSTSGVSRSVSLTIHLGVVPEDEVEVLLQGLIQGYSANPSHHTRIYVNGCLVDEALNWDARSEYSFTASFPSSYLVSGDNVVTVESVIDHAADSSQFYINWLEIEYPRSLVAEENQIVFNMPAGESQYVISGFSSSQVRVLDITNPVLPQRVDGFTVEERAGGYAVLLTQDLQEPRAFLAQAEENFFHPASILPSSAENLKSTQNGGDYLIITHPSLVAASQVLADYRAEQGLRTRVVDIQSIYDQFGYGLPDPNAIRDFLQYAFYYWEPPAPLYVLLMGDGNYDYRNNSGADETNYVPPLLYDIDPWINQAPADNRYAAVIGEDILPDLYIGRLPVRSVQEAQAVVGKIIAYEELPAELWNQQALFIADNNDDTNDFVESSTHTSGLLPDDYEISQVYYGVTHTSVSSAKNQILAEINAGRGMVQYTGHGSFFAWAGERLLAYADMPLLTNANRLPFVLSLDCMDGYFLFLSSATRDNSSLAEGLVRSPTGGAIATFSPAGYGLVEGHDLLATGFYEAIFQHGMNRAGAAATYAKYYLASHTTGHRELIDTYTLFGDPALQLKLGPTATSPQADLQVLLSLPSGRGEPGEWVDVQVYYANIGQAPADGITLSLPLPDSLIDASVTADPAITQHLGDPYRWVLPGLDPGAGGRILLHARIDPSYLGEFPLTAEIRSLSSDANPANNQDSTLLSVNPADVSGTLSLLSPGWPAPGDTVELRLDYNNQGVEASNLLLTLFLPPQLLDPALTVPLGWIEQPGTPYKWSMSTLPAGSSGSILIQGNLAAGQTGSFPIQASLESNTFDENPANNTHTFLLGSYYRRYFPQIFRGW